MKNKDWLSIDKSFMKFRKYMPQNERLVLKILG